MKPFSKRKFTDACVSRVRAEVSLHDVASRYTVLKAKGGHFEGCCPLHTEKTPSFHVRTDNSFKCFGCGKSGDVIQFVRDIEHLSFPEAVEKLANQQNIPLEYEGGANATFDPDQVSRSDLFAIYAAAAAFYRERFLATESVRSYWTNDRGFLPETAETFGIGFAPADDAGALAQALWGKFDPASIRRSSLFFAKTNGLLTSPAQLVPRFAGRLMIPIHDAQGRVCAFSGRVIPGIEATTPDAKYYNSPETPIFKKGALLFNFARVRESLREVPANTRITIVEGQLDVMRLWENGIKLVVAPQGTALTVEQLRILGAFPNGVRFLLDGDKAGEKACLRIAALSLEAESDAVFDLMPDEHDPDSILMGLDPQSAALRFNAITAHSRNATLVALKLLMPEASATPQARAKAVRNVLDMLSHSPSPTTVWYAIEEMAKALRVDGRALWAEYSRTLPPIPPDPGAPAPTPEPPTVPAVQTKASSRRDDFDLAATLADQFADRRR